jgi:non-canonical (house-cleaning) NTP pyrophosphatase
MKIILTSTNKAKIEATEKVVKKLFLNANVESMDVETGVSKTPTTDDEGIEGAINRINSAIKIDDRADVYVGLEGIITKNKYGTFICGWAVVKTKDKKEAFGCSAKVKLPSFIADTIEDFKELSTEVKNNYPSELIEQMPILGSNGIITNKLYTRVDEFEDALLCAFGYLGNEKNYINVNYDKAT